MQAYAAACSAPKDVAQPAAKPDSHLAKYVAALSEGISGALSKYKVGPTSTNLYFPSLGQIKPLYLISQVPHAWLPLLSESSKFLPLYVRLTDWLLGTLSP